MTQIHPLRTKRENYKSVITYTIMVMFIVGFNFILYTKDSNRGRGKESKITCAIKTLMEMLQWMRVMTRTLMIVMIYI